MIILADIDKCVGCRACEIACAKKHSGEGEGVGKALLLAARRARVGIAVGETKPVPIHCRHCEEAYCMYACITGAMHRDLQTGMVLIDEDKCVGCLACLKMCPYFSILPDLEGLQVRKCDLCMMEELPPVCVEACRQDALAVEGVREIDEDKCIGCGLCESLCYRDAIKIEETDKGRKAKINEKLCKGCGICAAACPRDAIIVRYFTDDKVKEDILSLLEVR